MRAARGYWVIAAAALGCFLGCNAIIGLDLGESETFTPCQLDSDCLGDSSCASARCSSSKVCEVVPLPDVVPDDANACTVDRCDGITAVHEAVGDGTTCSEGLGSGQCQGGQCDIPCTQLDAMTVCDDQEPCTVDSCDLALGRCVRTELDGVLTPGVLVLPGDCQRHWCIEGANTRVIDDTDLPADVACFDEVCSGGVPSKAPSAMGEPCGDGTLACDGLGACVGCTGAAQCPSSFCAPAVCAAGTCGASPEPEGTPLPGQQSGDCVIRVCDGTGGEEPVPDDADTPPSDMLECTGDVCMNGAPQSINLTGTVCTMGGIVCNAGACVECLMADMCPDTDPSDCTAPTCSPALECGMAPHDAGQICTSGGGAVCNAIGDCVGCNVAADCPTPPEECKVRDCVNEACVPANAMDGSSCTNGTCQGGECKLSVGQYCLVPGDCLSGNCPSADNVCCDTPCDDICEFCTPGGGCINSPAGTDPDGDCSVPGMLNCNGNGMCGP